jgi:hypothetical protein
MIFLIKQEVFLDQDKIMTVYHKGFDDYPVDRKISKSKTINGYKLIFHEEYLDSIDAEKIVFEEQITGFLDCENKKNPYSNYCCDYTEFINYNKKNIIDEFLNDKNTFNKISDFIKKWTGLDLEKCPFLINNFIIYNPKSFHLDIRLDDSESKDRVKLNIIKNKYEDLFYLVKFKINNLVVDTKIYNQENKIISSNKEWNLIDLEVYTVKKQELIYANYDISFIRSINISMNLVSKAGTKKMNSKSREVDLKHYSSEPIKIGETTDIKEITNYLYNEKVIAEQFKEKTLFEFLTENEYEKALDILQDIADSSTYDELWIFDPYAIHYDIPGGKKRLEDVYSVLANTISLKKYIIYRGKCNGNSDVSYQKEDYEDEFTNFLTSIDNLEEIVNNSRFEKLNFTFKGTRKKFHDRFIFLKNDDILKGYLLGASINYFGENYSLIMELKERKAKYIFKELNNKILAEENMVLEKDI